jgi:hypothetical protein
LTRIRSENRQCVAKLLAALAAPCNEKTGLHIDCGKDTPVTNLLLAMLDRVGVRPARLGDSTGLLEI